MVAVLDRQQGGPSRRPRRLVGLPEGLLSPQVGRAVPRLVAGVAHADQMLRHSSLPLQPAHQRCERVRIGDRRAAGQTPAPSSSTARRQSTARRTRPGSKVRARTAGRPAFISRSTSPVSAFLGATSNSAPVSTSPLRPALVVTLRPSSLKNLLVFPEN